MAKPVKHTVEGLTDTRMSPRNYTFATVVTVSPDYERKHVMPRDVSQSQMSVPSPLMASAW